MKPSANDQPVPSEGSADLPAHRLSLFESFKVKVGSILYKILHKNSIHDQAVLLHMGTPETSDQPGKGKSDIAESHFNHAENSYQAGRISEALASFDHAIALQPDFALAHNRRGVMLLELNRLDEALASFDHAIALQPDLARAHSNRGIILNNYNRLEEALVSFDRAIALQPDFALAHNNRGALLRQLNRVDEGLASCDRAIALKPDLVNAYWNKSLLKLLDGNYNEGWPLYEWRWKGVQRDSARNFNKPLWLGQQSIDGLTLLIHAEQGLGDVIQFCRYVPLVEKLGANVILEAPASLMALLGTLKGKFTLVESGKSLPDFDMHCPIMSLPLAFRTTLETIPVNSPYLFADKEKKMAWQERLGPKTRPRVGLVWSGGIRLDQPDQCAMNERRNVKLSMMACLRGLDIDYYSLQKGQPAESELSELRSIAWDGPTIIDHTSQLIDFSDTAALIDNLDLVISVCTSTAHLAAALGKPVWILIHVGACWRWMLDRSNSPWYPTATLFRQPAIGDWDSVIAEVTKKLSEMPSGASVA